MTKEEIKQYNREYQQKNKDIIRERKKIYTFKNKKNRKKYLALHKDQIKQQRKKYYEKNKKNLIQKSIQYWNLHQQEKKEYNKYYHKTHKQKRNYRLKIRRKIDVNFKISHNLRSRIYHTIKGHNKSAHTTELLGCTIDQLKEHLQSKFVNGMTWSNYGRWHIDHIRPCASFDLSLPEQQKECFHYTNLQPLWAEDNIRKGGKF